MYFYLSDKDIEGVYEMNIPSEFNFITSWGDIVQPMFSKIGLTQSALLRTYSPNELVTCNDLLNEDFDESLISKIIIFHL